MNRYDRHFTAQCPTDGVTIAYHLTIKTNADIMVEAILEACHFSEPVYHEVIANQLAERFGGKQKLRALHQGVHITTKRNSHTRNPSKG